MAAQPPFNANANMEASLSVLEVELKHNTQAILNMAEQIREVVNEHRSETRGLQREVSVLKQEISDVRLKVEIGRAQVSFGGAIARFIVPAVSTGIGALILYILQNIPAKA